jgi:hypothetical protein
MKVRVIAVNDVHGNIDGANLTLGNNEDNIFLTNAGVQLIGVPDGAPHRRNPPQIPRQLSLTCLGLLLRRRS